MQATSASQVDTAWYWLVTVMGGGAILEGAAGHGVMVARGAAFSQSQPRERTLLALASSHSDSHIEMRMVEMKRIAQSEWDSGEQKHKDNE